MKVFDNTKLLISTLKKLSINKCPIDTRKFALAIKALPNNKFGSQFYVTMHVVGWRCIDFDDMISMAHASCMIEYLSTTFNEFQILISDRLANRWFNDFTEEEQKEALELLTEFKRLIS